MSSEKETKEDYDKIIIDYKAQGFTCKEDVMFEMLLYILMNQLHRRDLPNIQSIEESYRRAYHTLPHYTGFRDTVEENREVIINALNTLEEISKELE